MNLIIIFRNMRARFLFAVLPIVAAPAAAAAQHGPIGTLEIKSAGMRIHSPIMTCRVAQTAVIDRIPDVFSSKLFQSRNEHEVLTEIILHINSPSDRSKYKVITLHNAVVQSIADVRTPAGPSEEIVFTFDREQVLYYSGGLASRDSW